MLMKKVALCALGFLAALPASTAEKLTFVERAQQDDFVTRIEGKEMPGDLILFRNNVFDSSNETAVGYDSGYCVRVIGGGDHCTVTLVLNDGTLSATGLFSLKGDSTLVVSGGSGKYFGTSSTLQISPRDSSGSTFTFTVSLE